MIFGFKYHSDAMGCFWFVVCCLIGAVLAGFVIDWAKW